MGSIPLTLKLAPLDYGDELFQNASVWNFVGWAAPRGGGARGEEGETELRVRENPRFGDRFSDRARFGRLGGEVGAYGG